jgi:polyhydroxybutyrate depolymerase
MMALRLGCQTDTFAAIAPVAGTLLTDCSGARPTSVLQIHGTADDRVPYNGGPGKAFSADGTARADGHIVEFISVKGAGHQWPGGDPSPVAQWIGNIPAPSTALNATDTIWEFFAANRR